MNVRGGSFCESQTMKNKPVIVLAIGAFALVIYLTVTGAKTVDSSGDVSVDRGTALLREDNDEQGPRYRMITETERDQALVELKAKWNRYFELKDSGGDKSELHRMKVELAEESAFRLLASRQVLALLLFLDEKNSRPEGTILRRKLRELFESDRVDELTEPLLEAITKSYDQLDSKYRSDAMGWSFLLGKHGPEEAAVKFQEQVDNPWPLGDFLHGWYLSRAEEDPQGSYAAMVEFLKNGGKGKGQGGSLENIVKAFPEDREYDYEALESILPIVERGPDAEVYKKARRGLLTKWAEDEPAEAANYIIANPERVPADLVTPVVRQAIKDLRFDGIEWVKEFPEGVYYDMAAVAVVEKLWDTHPAEAREWAGSIGDEKVRETQLRRIEAMNRPGVKR